MSVNLNTDLSTRNVNFSALQQAAEKLTGQNTTLPPLFGKDSSVYVDLDKLVSTLQKENNSAQQNSATNYLSTAFDVVLARREELDRKTTENLENAQEYNNALAGVNQNISTYTNQIAATTTEIANLNTQKTSLETQLAAETDTNKKAEIQKKLDGVNQSLTNANEKLKELNAKLTEATQQKAELETKIKNCMNGNNALRAMLSAMKVNIGDIVSFSQELDEEERSKEEEKFLNENDPMVILQLAIEKWYERFGDEIISNKTNLA